MSTELLSFSPSEFAVKKSASPVEVQNRLKSYKQV